VANTLEYFLHVLHKSVMEYGFVQLDMTKVSLTFIGLSAGLAYITFGGNSKSEVIWAWINS
jgi:hypothetical protein